MNVTLKTTVGIQQLWSVYPFGETSFRYNGHTVATPLSVTLLSTSRSILKGLEAKSLRFFALIKVSLVFF